MLIFVEEGIVTCIFLVYARAFTQRKILGATEGSSQQQIPPTNGTRPDLKLGPVSWNPWKRCGPVKPRQSLKPYDYRVILFTSS